MLTLYPPAIPYKKKKTKDSTTTDDSKFIKVEVPFGRPKNTKGTEWSIAKFDDGTPEEWIKWRIQYDALVNQCPLKTADEKFTMIRATLEGRALDVFLTTYPTDLSDLTDTVKQYYIGEGLMAVSRGVFNDDTSAWRRQRNYMRYHLHFQVGQLHEFRNRLYESCQESYD